MMFGKHQWLWAMWVLGLLAAFLSQPVRADLLWQKLPADGTWVTFECFEDYADGTKRKLWITLKSVGQEKSGDQPCRWVELKYQNEEARKEMKGSVLKFLIPEKELEPGGDPFSRVVKAWKLTLGEQPMAIEDVAALRHRLNLIFSPPIKDLKKTRQRKVVETPKEKLRATVWTGNSQYQLAGDKISAAYSLGLHDDSPTGVAWARIELSSSPSGAGTVEYLLTESGTDAVSDLPESK